MIEDFLPPFSQESEQALLGSLMIDHEIYLDICDIVDQEDFYLESHRNIFKAISVLAERNLPTDILAVNNELCKLGINKEIGYLTTLTNSIPTSSMASYYAKIISEKSLFRRTIALGQKISSIGLKADLKAEDVVEKVSQLYTTILEKSKRSSGVSSTELFERAKDYIPSEKTWLIGLPTGFLDLDLITGGYIDSQLIFVAGRPGMGKTAFILNAVMHGSKVLYKKKIEGKYLFYSLEQSLNALAVRCTAMRYNRKTILDLRRGNLSPDERGAIICIMDKLKSLPVIWFEEPDTSVNHFIRVARREIREHNIVGIIIDHVGQMTFPGLDGEREAFKVVGSLQAFARELNIPIIGLHQLSRGVENRADKRPTMADLRQTGNSEQCADLVLGLYRDEYYNPETSEKPGILEVNILKARDGATGSVDIIFNKRSLAMFDIDKNYGEDLFMAEGNYI